MDLSTKFDGLTLKNPLMPAAGPLVGDAEKMLWLKGQANIYISKCNISICRVIFQEIIRY